MDIELRGLLADMSALQRWAYRLPAQLERRFLSETDLERNHQIRFWVVCGLGFSWLNFVADLIVVPDVWRLAILLRLFVVTPLSLFAMRLLGNKQPAWLNTLNSVAPPAASLLAALLGFAVSTHVDTFRSFFVLAIGILWMNVLIPMRLKDALVFTLVTLTLGDSINIGAVWWHHGTIDHPEVIGTTHVLVALSIVARFVAERESRRNFVLGLRLRIRAEDLERSNTKLLELSNTDPLTGLANRRFFDLALAQALQTALVGQSSLAVMMIDVDHFKQFNDAAGHLEGDRCLTIIARTIAAQVRQGRDLAARFGGEEFVVLLPDTDHEDAYAVAERVRAAIGTLRVLHPGRIGRGFVSVSIGLAAVYRPACTVTPAELLAAADDALYAAKAAGRDQVMRANGPRPDVDAEADAATRCDPDGSHAMEHKSMLSHWP